MEDWQEMIKDCVNHLNNTVLPEKFTLVYSESAYDDAIKLYGENCGWDKNKVTVIRGYPKFDNNGK